MQACESLGYRYHLGIGYTTASFYIGQGRPIAERQGENGAGSTQGMAAEEQAAGGNPQSGYWPSFADNIIPDLRSAGVTNIEMEAAGQFVVGRLHGMRMGAVLAVIANRITDEWGDKGGEEKSAKAATEAIRILSEWDRTRKVELNTQMR
jgi:uridine phosphorylase